MNPYATHLPVLETLMEQGQIAVEFGCGIYSTPLLVRSSSLVVSIEMQNADWLYRVRDQVRDSISYSELRWEPHLAIGPWEFLSVPLPDHIDIALVDGHGKSRWGCVNYMMRLGVPVIVAHDTEVPRYRWDLINEDGYSREDHKTLTPWTTVWTKNK